jgi:hypothetical protein
VRAQQRFKCQRGLAMSGGDRAAPGSGFCGRLAMSIDKATEAVVPNDGRDYAHNGRKLYPHHEWNGMGARLPPI